MSQIENGIRDETVQWFYHSMEQVRGSGVRFTNATVSLEVGPEVIALLFEPTQFVTKVLDREPFDLGLRWGLVETSMGPVLSLLWWLPPLRNSAPFALYEQLLNPTYQGTLNHLERLARQTHLHLALVDRDGSSVAFFEFENEFGFDVMAGRAKGAMVRWGAVDFDQASAALQQETEIGQLFSSFDPTNTGKLALGRRLDKQPENEARDVPPVVGDSRQPRQGGGKTAAITHIHTATAAALGVFVGSYLLLAISYGVEHAFPGPDTQAWGLFVWGQHWFLRTSVSLLCTFAGAYIAGMAQPPNPRLAGTLTALPSVVSFIAIGIANLAFVGQFEMLSFGWWVAIGSIAALSVPVGRLGAEAGFEFRAARPQAFEGGGRWLGLHWSVFLWIWVPLYPLIAEASQLAVVALIAGFSNNFAVSFNVGRILITVATLSVLYGLTKGLEELSQGRRRGHGRLKQTGLVAAYLVALPTAAAVLSMVAFYLFQMDEPRWLTSINEFLIRAVVGSRWY